MNKQEIQNLIKDIIQNMNITVSDIIVETPENSKTTWYSIIVDQPHFFTNREGEALHALNHLVKRVLEKNQPVLNENIEGGHEGILIDIGDLQKKRVESVKAVAHMIAERARYFQSSVEVEPMSAFDRRIVHEYVSNHSDLKSESAGFGPSRHVVIKYIGNI
ncbi:MAG: hypothetical protein NTW62_02240 [Candidatus Nomurabacteria bacterium]|nr:hypothetical protein [Candidatus Nomurabacteria bacterium]